MQHRYIRWVAIVGLLAGPAVMVYLVARPAPSRASAEAEAAYHRYDFGLALRHLRRELDLQSNSSADLYLFAVRTARRAGALEEANRYLRAAERRGGDREAVMFERSLLHAQEGYAWKVEDSV